MIIASIEDYRKQCEARLPRFLYDYISGGSFQENSLRANIAELQATLLRQRVMVDESRLKLSIQLWDQALSLPVVLGPVGMAGMYSSRGEVKAANAAKAVGIPFTLSTHSPMEVSLQVSGQIQEMHPIVRDEVNRIGYEAIRNACVHSQATQLRVELSYAQDLSLRICDNGVGIDPDIVNRGKPGLFGLQSMRERTGRIVGKCSVESSAGFGTAITLTVPGGIIYRTVN
jgi:isopentenyl diphosphate isomerase/L-lactate dehydrogenase-like FMN-dependent dehydrogenase